MDGRIVSILIVNAGSSSVKFSLFRREGLELIGRALLDWRGRADTASFTWTRVGHAPVVRELDAPDYRSAVAGGLLELRGTVDARAQGATVWAIGHRLIHGGERIRRAVRIDADMKRTIAGFAKLAPLHIPPGLDAIEAVESALPGVPQAGVFDTAFHATLPPAAYLYPLPYAWYERWGIRRFGYHGISHAYCAARAAEMLDRAPTDVRLVICHLGQGASITAVRGGESIGNSMGFTPLEGLMMGTRCGSIDPGILLHVQREQGMTVEELDRALHHDSGLKGLSGISSDFREVEQAAAEGDRRAGLAMDVYAHRVRERIGAYVATLGGLDALVFTGGIGENARRLRADVCKGLEWMGIELDETRNASASPDADVASGVSRARALLIHTREDLMIARQTVELITQAKENP
ncbi:MAG: acetate kinase [Planctomycetes bacterium]|nr:acetate kinase [Planctomycetota bacterium]